MPHVAPTSLVEPTPSDRTTASPDPPTTVAATATVDAAPDAAAVAAAVPTTAVLNPNAPPADEVVAAVFPTHEAAERVAAALFDAGIPRELVVAFADREANRNFLKRYVHRDGDRHTHGGVAAVFMGLLCAVAMAMIGIGTGSQYFNDGFGPPVAALIGAVVGGVLGAVLGGLAMRTADDSSIEIIESIAAGGELVAVRRPTDRDDVSLDEAGRVLERHNGRAVRLRYKPHQADRHPGDLRSSASLDQLATKSPPLARGGL